MSEKPADFFQPDHLYAYKAGAFTAPEVLTVFLAEHITKNPATEAPMAFGWIRTGESETWTPYAEPADDWPEGWTDITSEKDLHHPKPLADTDDSACPFHPDSDCEPGDHFPAEEDR